MELKGSQTEKNLLTAFAGESQARNRYTYFASHARKEGYQQISAIFEETANQEKEHAKREFKFLKGGEVEIAAAFPAGVIGELKGGSSRRTLRMDRNVSWLRRNRRQRRFP
jgi:rubrerythrin